jgi:hypothetical protein
VTHLDKPVTRETRQFHRGRPLLVSLNPAGYVEIRPKGLRSEVWRMSFESIILEAARRLAEHERADRARERRTAPR